MKKYMMIPIALLCLLTFGLHAQETRSPETTILDVSLSLQTTKNLPAIVAPYSEALIVRVVVEEQAFDAQPPGIETFLYIGSLEARPFQLERNPKSDLMELVFHVPKWQNLEEGASMVLTTRHGDPAQNGEAYRDRGLPTFSFGDIDDRR